MSINSVSSSVTQALQNVSATSATSACAPASATDADQDTTRVSGPAQLLAKLKKLQESDPAKFKEVMSKIADTLKADAASSTDPNEQKMLTGLAAKFESAGQSGDLSALTPPKGGHHHGGGHHGGGGPKPASSTSTDPADTNKDGTVSEAERAAYEASRAAPQSAAAYAKTAQSGDHAKMQETMNQLTAIVDAAL